MKILLAASDLTPLIATDERSLARAIPALPLALQQAGHEVSVIGPLAAALETSPELKIKATGVRISVALGNERPTVEVREARSPQGLQMFLFRQPEVFGPEPAGLAMDARAATLFSKLIVELARRLNPAPDVVQIHDWPGALAPVFLKAQNLPFASVLAVSDPTMHGSFPVEDFGLLNLGWEYFRPTSVEFYGRVNFLKAGIVASDAVVVDGDLERAGVQTSEQGGGWTWFSAKMRPGCTASPMGWTKTPGIRPPTASSRESTGPPTSRARRRAGTCFWRRSASPRIRSDRCSCST